jgi:PAS domain S-box-containing protein
MADDTNGGSSAERRQKTILLVEDQAIIAMTERSVLEKNGYAVVVAYDGERAIVAGSDPAVDLILMDIDLGSGKLDGTAAAEKILATREVPIVFLTSHSEREMVDRVRGITRYGYVLKNAGEFVLVQSIETAFELFGARQRLERENAERRRAEAEARTHAALYRSLMENSIDAVYLLSETGSVLNVNAVACTMLGYAREEILTLTIDDIDPNYPSVNFVHFWSDKPEGSTVLFQSRHRRRDGAILDVEVNGIFFVLDGRKQLFGVARDISERKRMEAALVESEAKYRRFFENTPSLVMEVDIDTHEIVSCNPAMAASIGAPVETVAGQRIDRFLPESILQTREEHARIAVGENVVRTFADEREGRHFRTTFVPVATEGRRMVQVISMDVTELVRTRQQLEERERHLQTVADQLHWAERVANVGAWEWDIATDTWSFSDQWLRIHGAADAGLSTEQLLTLAHPDDLPEIRAALTAARSMRTRYDVHHRIVRHDTGEVRFIHALGEVEQNPVDGTPVRMVGTGQDVTEYVRREQELREAELIQSELVKGGRVGLWDWDLATDAVRYSPEWKAQLGYEAHELDDELSEFHSRVHPDDVDRLTAAVERTIRTAAQDHEVRFRLRHRNGDYRWILAQASIVTDADGTAIRMIGSHIDITRIVESEAQLQQALEKKDLLMRELNHRVKNNLLIVSSLISLKDRELAPSVSISDIAAKVDAIRLLHETLQYSEDVSSVPLGPYLRDLLTNVFSGGSHPVETVVSIGEDAVSSQVAVTLGLIVSELATNAVKHGFVPGAAAKFAIRMEEEGGDHVVTVSQTGRPIPDHIQLDNPTTLGLQLVSMLVRQLKGTVELQRAPTPRFTIRFPRRGS